MRDWQCRLNETNAGQVEKADAALIRNRMAAVVKLAAFIASFASLHHVRLLVTLVTSADRFDKDTEQLTTALAVAKVPVE